jgi:hypothetical protein
VHPSCQTLGGKKCLVPVVGRVSIVCIPSSQGLPASLNTQTPPKAADCTITATTPASCVATSLESNRVRRRARGSSFSLSVGTVPSAPRPPSTVSRPPVRLGPGSPQWLLAQVRLQRENGCKCRAESSRLAAFGGCRLTLPSRGCPKGCAFCAPLMSNVRRRRSTPAVNSRR